MKSFAKVFLRELSSGVLGTTYSKSFTLGKQFERALMFVSLFIPCYSHVCSEVVIKGSFTKLPWAAAILNMYGYQHCCFSQHCQQTAQITSCYRKQYLVAFCSYLSSAMFESQRIYIFMVLTRAVQFRIVTAIQSRKLMERRSHLNHWLRRGIYVQLIKEQLKYLMTRICESEKSSHFSLVAQVKFFPS